MVSQSKFTKGKVSTQFLPLEESVLQAMSQDQLLDELERLSELMQKTRAALAKHPRPKQTALLRRAHRALNKEWNRLDKRNEFLIEQYSALPKPLTYVAEIRFHVLHEPAAQANCVAV